MSKFRFFVLLSLLFTATLVALIGLVKVRSREFRLAMATATDKTLFLRTLSLVSKFQLMRRRFSGEEGIRLLSIEAKLRLMQIDALDQTDILHESGIFTVVGFGLVNAVNFMAGTPVIREKLSSRHEHALEEAYHHELRRDFPSAILKYDEALRLAPQGENASFASFVLLHRGFCQVLVGQPIEGLSSFQHVLQNQANGEYRETAKTLIRLTNEMHLRIHRANLIKSSAERGIALYRAGAYNLAIKALTKPDITHLTPREEYALARSYEETGSNAQAIERYRGMIMRNASGKYARLANRRIYAMGMFYANNDELKTESNQNARTRFSDRDLLALIEKNDRVFETMPDKERAPRLVTVEMGRKNIKSAGMGRSTAHPKQPPWTGLEERESGAMRREDFDILSREERARLLQQNEFLDLLLLKDGNRIFGKIVAESEDVVAINTLMGRLEFQRVSLEKIDTIESAGIFGHD